ncbi:DUF6544 family protein [Haliscomenobacter sp.]|uniref:DUF6544 family protein n=1 Tax=Haliscomenobacter sp. TaxID=2717303 RepID=UPI0035940FF4
MSKILYYLPELTYFITAWLLLDLLGSGLFRLLVRPRAKQNWEAAQSPVDAPTIQQNQPPQPWLDYLTQSSQTHPEPSARVRLRMKGVVRSSPKGKWHPAEIKAFFTLQPLTMVWYADITRAFMVSVKATEQYGKSQGFSTRWLLSTFPFRWKKEALPQILAQRNAFYTLAAAVWQPYWWSYYDLTWEKFEADSLEFTCKVEGHTFFLKAKINDQQELEELSLWSENWQEWQAALRWSDYRLFQEQKMPFQVEVLRKDKVGEAFIQANLQVTDVVQKGKYAWW